MTATNTEEELLQLPDHIHQARCAVLQTEQHLLAADRHYEHLRTHRYLEASASGDGHYKANSLAAAEPEVASARTIRDQWEAERKQAEATHTRLRDRLRVLLSLQPAREVSN